MIFSRAPSGAWRAHLGPATHKTRAVVLRSRKKLASSRQTATADVRAAAPPDWSERLGELKLLCAGGDDPSLALSPGAMQPASGGPWQYSGRARTTGSRHGRCVGRLLQRSKSEGVFAATLLRPKLLRSPRGPLWGGAIQSDNPRHQFVTSARLDLSC